jgi:hypothetical protein
MLVIAHHDVTQLDCLRERERDPALDNRAVHLTSMGAVGLAMPWRAWQLGNLSVHTM